MTDKIEAVMQVSMELLKLDQDEQELKARRAFLRRKLGALISSNGSAPASESLPERIIGYLSEHPGRSFRAAQVAKALDVEKLPVAITLARLKREERIDKEGKGRTGLYRAKTAQQRLEV